MKDLRIRASQLGLLMTNGRGAKTMGETAKGLVEDLYLKHTYGIEAIVNSKEMRKGIEQEAASIELYTATQGVFCEKNEAWFENDFIHGTPDIILSDKIVDVKTSWDARTFMRSELTPLYEWQLRAYMWLCGREFAEVAYCLVDMPNEMLSDELYRLQFQYTGGEDNPEYQRAADQLVINSQYSRIPANERIKIYTIERDNEMEQRIIDRVTEARNYYETLKLNMLW